MISRFALVAYGIWCVLGVPYVLGQSLWVSRGQWYSTPDTNTQQQPEYLQNNLTLHGQTDWKHYNDSNLILANHERKANVSPAHIGELSDGGNGVSMQVDLASARVSWTDGAIVPAKTNDTTYWIRDGTADGQNNPYFEIDVVGLGESGKVVVWIVLDAGNDRNPLTADVTATLYDGINPLEAVSLIGMSGRVGAHDPFGGLQRIEVDYRDAEQADKMTIRLEKTGGPDAESIGISSIALTLAPAITSDSFDWNSSSQDNLTTDYGTTDWVHYRYDEPSNEVSIDRKVNVFHHIGHDLGSSADARYKWSPQFPIQWILKDATPITDPDDDPLTAWDPDDIVTKKDVVEKYLHESFFEVDVTHLGRQGRVTVWVSAWHGGGTLTANLVASDGTVLAQEVEAVVHRSDEINKRIEFSYVAFNQDDHLVIYFEKKQGYKGNQRLDTSQGRIRLGAIAVDIHPSHDLHVSHFLDNPWLGIADSRNYENNANKYIADLGLLYTSEVIRVNWHRIADFDGDTDGEFEDEDIEDRARKTAAAVLDTFQRYESHVRSQPLPVTIYFVAYPLIQNILMHNPNDILEDVDPPSLDTLSSRRSGWWEHGIVEWQRLTDLFWGQYEAYLDDSNNNPNNINAAVAYLLMDNETGVSGSNIAVIHDGTPNPRIDRQAHMAAIFGDPNHTPNRFVSLIGFDGLTLEQEHNIVPGLPKIDQVLIQESVNNLTTTLKYLGEEEVSGMTPALNNQRHRWDAIADKWKADAMRKVTLLDSADSDEDPVAPGNQPYTRLDERFPGVKVANYKSMYMTRQEVVPIGNSSLVVSYGVAGTHSAPNFYATKNGGLRKMPVYDSQNPVYIPSNIASNIKAYRILRAEINRFRGNARSSNAPLLPWIARDGWVDNVAHTPFMREGADANSSLPGSGRYVPNYHKELIYHLALCGAEGFQFFNTIRANTTELESFDQALVNLNDRLGAHKRWPKALGRISWTSELIASGMARESDGSTVWRITLPPNHYGIYYVRRRHADGTVVDPNNPQPVVVSADQVGSWFTSNPDEPLTQHDFSMDMDFTDDIVAGHNF